MITPQPVLGRSLFSDGIVSWSLPRILADFAGVLRFVGGHSFLRRPKADGLPPACEGTVTTHFFLYEHCDHPPQ